MATQIYNKLSFNPKKPLLPHSIPSHPWQKIGTSILTWDSNDYLIIVNHFSQFLELDLLTHQDTISCYSEGAITISSPRHAYSCHQRQQTWDLCQRLYCLWQKQNKTKHREDCACHEEHQGLGEGTWQQPTGLQYQATWHLSSASDGLVTLLLPTSKELPTEADDNWSIWHYFQTSTAPSQVEAILWWCFTQFCKGDNWRPHKVITPISKPWSYAICIWETDTTFITNVAS